MLQALRTAVADPAQVSDRAIDRHATAYDASHFLLIPQAVVTAANANEVGALMRASAAQGVPLTLRSGGTSLSGQAVSDGVLVDVRKNFRDIEVLDDSGSRVRSDQEQRCALLMPGYSVWAPVRTRSCLRGGLHNWWRDC